MESWSNGAHYSITPSLHHSITPFLFRRELPMPIPIRQSDMEAVFRVTDELGIHREAITVPLARRDPGGVTGGAGKLTITVPESLSAEEWAETTLREELAKLGYEELP